MPHLTPETIAAFADSTSILKRGEFLYRTGTFRLLEHDPACHRFTYEVDGHYGDYRTEARLGQTISCTCSCPYPQPGCKHSVAILFDILQRQQAPADPAPALETKPPDVFLSPEEIRQQALDDRAARAKREQMFLFEGDMLKGDHTVQTPTGTRYQVTLHEPSARSGHCSCPDYLTNRLNTCKHLLFAHQQLNTRKNFLHQCRQERFPYVDIYWDSELLQPRLHNQRQETLDEATGKLLDELFDAQGRLYSGEITALLPALDTLETDKHIRIQPAVMNKIEQAVLEHELEQASSTQIPNLSDLLKIQPYPYQEEGIRFTLFRQASLIGDEMGLGKTLQAIAAALLKKEIFGFDRVLIITLASLKEQWQREIERFTHHTACIIEGGAAARQEQYRHNSDLFKITNYEAVLRDTAAIERFRPDLIILDEAQRIKNFTTKTAAAIKRLPRQHALVLTGTPLENKLEDVYSIVQFLQPDLLSPLWQFAADHFLLSRTKKGKILGYRNLERLHDKLENLVIRRTKEAVLTELPDQIRNDYFIDLHPQQADIHNGYFQSLLPLLNKKFLTPMDLRRIQMLLLKMRQVCDSTHLIDRETNISPKLAELASIVDELVIQNNRKVVIFSEWTTMTALIGRQLSAAQIPFVELSGKIPVKKRQLLIDEFTTNPDCKVFLSTDAGGTGLNLQAADSVINFELPWNPAKLQQRIGRINRIGQQARCINVINLIAKQSIEERILTGIQMKTDVFDAVFSGSRSTVVFDRERHQALLKQLRTALEDDQSEFIRPPEEGEELLPDTPHYLNPQVLQEQPTDYVGEEPVDSIPATPAQHAAPAAQSTAHSPEKMEEVLNQGMAFLGGLLEMATGSTIQPSASSDKMVSVDQTTGEVTLKFKLPGF